jgi:hypothetical protein
MPAPVILTIGPVTVTFTWSGDRWSHRVTLADGGAWDSLEGPRPEDGDGRWPASPVLVELSRIETALGPAILGVGLAGRSHFSASIGPDPAGSPGVRFEIACRCHEGPLWLGSTYRGPAGIETIRPAAAPSPPATVQWAYTFAAAGLAACDRTGNRSDS